MPTPPNPPQTRDTVNAGLVFLPVGSTDAPAVADAWDVAQHGPPRRTVITFPAGLNILNGPLQIEGDHWELRGPSLTERPELQRTTRGIGLVVGPSTDARLTGLHINSTPFGPVFSARKLNRCASAAFVGGCVITAIGMIGSWWLHPWVGRVLGRLLRRGD